MGQAKQLLPVDGRPLLGVVVAQLCASRLDEVVVVLGARAEEILVAVDLGRACAILNPEHRRASLTSLTVRVAGGAST
jgi:CTP:molybdopterin cytidylyltransferase MocA